MSTETILWFDFETFGSLSRPWDHGRSGPYPRRDRPAQFGAIRTDLDLNPVESEIELRCRASVEEPPSIGACLVTGIAPGDTEDGLEEADFMAEVLSVLGRPGTTGTGWNSLGYDDEIVRFGAWRNLLPPYDREWMDDNARFDLLPAFRFAWATGRRDGIEWPAYEDGSVSLSLGDLAAANGIEEHAESAHDALGDVRATIELARLLRTAQPRLWQYAFDLRRKRAVADIVDQPLQPFVLSDRGIGAARGHATVAVVVDRIDNNGRLVLDLHGDPTEILDLDPRQLHARFHRIDPEAPRIPVRRLRTNKLPMVATPRVLDAAEAGWTNLDLDPGEVEGRLRFVRENHTRILERLRLIADEPPDGVEIDAEERLYAGFTSRSDVAAMASARAGGPEAIRTLMRRTEDERVEELAFRFLARTAPNALDEEESARWRAVLQDRLAGPGGGEEARSIEALRAVEAARSAGADPRVVRGVEEWIRRLAAEVGMELPRVE